jgi:metal-responsive CopG/Arc/MetJ family transcriptional regulator
LHRTSVMLPVSLHREATTAAREDHVNLSIVVRAALRDYLLRRKRAQARRSA